ncbi:hypothetical protein SAMN06265222_1076 [Neorhodopirellula lusitana]|uniref:Uncharacterized protein n=1 Tax=Neorhodopirellula lusitana TaxID=445327 RepID=A0ABY1Q5Z3_9BACT|nr:hypothetical protein SAMN06265222_1076 [Neorhodopirellula lusitana]
MGGRRPRYGKSPVSLVALSENERAEYEVNREFNQIVHRRNHMTTNGRLMTPLIIAIVATLISTSCLVLGRSYRIDQVELDQLDAEIGRVKTFVDQELRIEGKLSPERAREVRQSAARLRSRLSELQSNSKRSLPAQTLSALAMTGMVVSILGNGLYLYRKSRVRKNKELAP